METQEGQLPGSGRLKASSPSLDDLARFCRLDPDYMDDLERSQLAAMGRAAVDYLKAAYALDEEYMDAHEDIAIAVMVLARDMYDHRTMDAYNSASANRTVQAIMSAHDFNIV